MKHLNDNKKWIKKNKKEKKEKVSGWGLTQWLV